MNAPTHAHGSLLITALIVASTSAIAQQAVPGVAEGNPPAAHGTTCSPIGTCEAKTTSTRLWQPVTEPLPSLCLTPLLVAPNISMTARIVGGPEPTEPQLAIARSAAMPTIALYRAQSTPRLLDRLRAAGVDAKACTSDMPKSVPRLHTTLVKVVADTGDTTGQTWRTRLDVELGLLVLDRPDGPSGPRVWSGRFDTGDLLARFHPDPHVVESFADHAARALLASGWLSAKPEGTNPP